MGSWDREALIKFLRVDYKEVCSSMSSGSNGLDYRLLK